MFLSRTQGLQAWTSIVFISGHTIFSKFSFVFYVSHRFHFQWRLFDIWYFYHLMRWDVLLMLPIRRYLPSVLFYKHCFPHLCKVIGRIPDYSLHSLSLDAIFIHPYMLQVCFLISTQYRVSLTRLSEQFITTQNVLIPIVTSISNRNNTQEC